MTRCLLLLLLPSLAFAQAYPFCQKPASDSKSEGRPVQQVANQFPEFLSQSEDNQLKNTSKLGQGFTGGGVKQSGYLATDLALTMRSRLKSPEALARWNDARDALQLLSPAERDSMVLKSFALKNKFAASDVPTGQELIESLKLTRVNAQVVTLEKTIDPRTIEAYLGGKKNTLTGEQLLQLHDDGSWRVLNLQTTALFGRGGLTKPGDVLMVGVGEGTRPGGLGRVPLGQPVAFGTLADGNLCLRPANQDDWKLGFSTNKIGRAWDPSGFRDVGLLIWRTNDGRGRTGAPTICSFVRIGGDFAVTAAHCVIESGRGSPVRLRNYLNAGVEAVALLPQFEVDASDPLACFDKPGECGFYVSRLVSPPQLPNGFGWPISSRWPVPDVALLKTSFPSLVPPAHTGVASGTSADERLTIAGYGINNAVGSYKWGELLVGWQQRPPKFDSTGLVWSVDVKNGAAGGCGGDSGGAVFDGDIAGVPKEKRILAGVISSGETARTGESEVTKCANAISGRAARLDTLLPWLCKQSNNIILGCPGNEVQASN